MFSKKNVMLFKPPVDNSSPTLQVIDSNSGKREVQRVYEIDSDEIGNGLEQLTAEITKFGSITLLNNSAVFENGDLLTIVPKGLSINDLNIVSFEKDAGYFQSSLTIDALYLNCKNIQEDDILEKVFWINPVFENIEGNIKSINYTIRFSNKDLDNSSIYFIIAILVFTAGLVFIILLTLSKFGQVKSLQRRFKVLSAEQQQVQTRKTNKRQ
jgi:hypothetical protein